jgi:hypothetical protein
MPVFKEFLSAFELGLVILRRRIERPEAQRPAVRYRPDAGEAGPDEVQVGVGRFATICAGEIHGAGVCLNNKGASVALGSEKAFPSVTDLVFKISDVIFADWRRVVAGDRSPDRFFERFTLIVEDASPDSCFGLFCFLLRLAGLTPDTIPHGWIQYVRQWEMGVSLVGKSPYEAYGCLHNALVHRTVEHDVEHEIAQSWLDGLRLLCEALGSDEPPSALATSKALPQMETARAFLAFEEQAYEEGLSHALCVQLSLPMVGTKNRHRVVDAYLAEETVPLGSLKVFAHTDRVRPFLKAGFSLLAIHRQITVGDDFDCTISVDPYAGVELSELWRKLEEEEDKKWGSERPCADPRRDIRGYPDGTRTGGRNAPDEPWYDGHDYTLLAAPRRLRDGRLGSKLRWTDVREALWEVYQPFRNLKVTAPMNAAASDSVAKAGLVSLAECRPETLPAGSHAGDLQRPRHLFLARWHRPDNTAPAFRITPTLGRYLAACVNRHPAASSSVSLSELPDETSYRLIELPSGVAVITEHGAFVLDAGRHDQVRFEPLKDEFCRALRILHRLEASEKGTRRLLDETRAYFRGERRDLSQADLLRRLSLEQIELALEQHRARTAQAIPEARLFREALLAHWGIGNWLDWVFSDVERIENVLSSRSELLDSRQVTRLTAAGLPLLFTVPLGAAFLTEKTHDWKAVVLIIAGLILLNLSLFLSFLRLTAWLDRRLPRSRAR